jgi:hypothetical protein
MKYGSAVVLLLAVGACSTIREEMPTSSSNVANAPAPAPIPVVVVPVPVPVPTSAPAPAPAPNPVPNPGPTNPNPAPAPPGGGGNGHTNNPVTQVTAGVHSYLRNGKLVPTGGTEFRVGDVIYLNCTPRDEGGSPTNIHGPLQAWFVSGDAAYNVTDTDTFNPDLHAHGPGKVNIACRVDNITSPTKRLNISQ